MTEKMPRYNQLSEQQLDGHERPTVLVRRGDDTITTGTVLPGYDPRYPERKLVAVDTGVKSLDPTERFTDSAQEALAAELAGESLRNQEFIDDVPLSERMGQAALAASGVESPLETSERADATYANLSSSARDELEQLRRLQKSQADAHSEGDWSGSTTFKQQAFMFQQGLSEEAQAYLASVDQQRRRPRRS